MTIPETPIQSPGQVMLPLFVIAMSPCTSGFHKPQRWIGTLHLHGGIQPLGDKPQPFCGAVMGKRRQLPTLPKLHRHFCYRLSFLFNWIAFLFFKKFQEGVDGTVRQRTRLLGYPASSNSARQKASCEQQEVVLHIFSILHCSILCCCAKSPAAASNVGLTNPPGLVKAQTLRALMALTALWSVPLVTTHPFSCYVLLSSAST